MRTAAVLVAWVALGLVAGLVLRAVLERTRGDVTATVVQSRLQRAIEGR